MAVIGTPSAPLEWESSPPRRLLLLIRPAPRTGPDAANVTTPPISRNDPIGTPAQELPLPRTGERASVSGIYRNDCHAKQIALSKGEEFPPCDHCHRAANWTLVQATTYSR